MAAFQNEGFSSQERVAGQNPQQGGNELEVQQNSNEGPQQLEDPPLTQPHDAVLSPPHDLPVPE